MFKLLKYLEVPHITKFKWQWLRRVMIIISFPQETVRAIYGVFCGAKLWWNWDGTVSPDQQWPLADGSVIPAPVFKQ
jgi:hypothetical protein